MRIHCILHRKGGTTVSLGQGKEARHYHFKPLDPKAALDDEKHDHVAEVTQREDIAAFLRVPEAYTIHPSEGAPATKAEAKAETAPDGKGGKQGGDANPDAGEDTTGRPDDPNDPYAALSREDLVLLYTEKVGNAPAKTMKTENMVKKLKELDEQE